MVLYTKERRRLELIIFIDAFLFDRFPHFALVYCRATVDDACNLLPLN